MPERVPESAIKFYEDRLVTKFPAADEQLGRTSYLTGREISVANWSEVSTDSAIRRA
jgi:hypothetical protein